MIYGSGEVTKFEFSGLNENLELVGVLLLERTQPNFVLIKSLIPTFIVGGVMREHPYGRDRPVRRTRLWQAGEQRRAGQNLARAARSVKSQHALKLLILLIYTVPTTIYFAVVGMIEWQAGVFLALGQIIGAYGAARLFSLNEKLKTYIPYFVLGMLILTALRILLP